MHEQADTLDDLLGARFSCRAFLQNDIADATLREIVTSAGKAPSWCNAQPWSVILTKGAATRKLRALLRAAHASNHDPAPDFDWPVGYSGAYLDRRRAVGWQLYHAVGVQKGDREGAARQSARNFVMFDAPHVAIVHCPAELGSYGAIDCGGFITTFCLAAQARGLATIPQAAPTAYCPQIRDHFNLPADRRIVCAIALGQPDLTHAANSFRAPRAPLEEICDIVD